MIELNALNGVNHMLITAHRISKYHNDKCIFKEISFSLEEGEKIAIIGINGTGKSTLLNIVSGKENYDGESMLYKRNLKVSMLEQDPTFDEDATIIEQIQKEMADEKIEMFEIKSILSKLSIYNLDEKIKVLSGGQKKRVALAITLLKPSELLILDEPTNHLDSAMIEWLEKFLIKTNKAILMVTHDRYFLDRITSTIYEIDRESLFKYEANYSRFLELKQQREENELSQERKRNAFLKKELEWVRAGVQARGTKSRERLEKFEKLSNIDAIKKVDTVKLINVESRLGKKTIEWDNLSMRFDDKILFDDFRYIMKRNDRIGIIGENGCGKSTFLNLIAKELKPTSGEIIYGETVRLGYFKQGCEEMDESKRVIDYIRGISDNLTTSEGNFSASVMLERFLFDSRLQYAKIAQLSGGERRRLYLLKILMQAPNILLFDEPTNDLDIETLTILEDYLDSFNGALIVVSHDRYFLDRICDSLFVFENGNVTSQIGGYSMYLEKQEKETKLQSAGAMQYAQQKQEAKTHHLFMSSKEKKELEMMEAELIALEENVENIDKEMEHISDFEVIDKLSKEREEYIIEIEKKNERWIELLEKEEQIRNNKMK